MDSQKAVSLVKTVLSNSPNAEQLNALHNRIHDWLIAEKDAKNPGFPEPYEWLFKLITHVMEKQISVDEAISRICESEYK